MSSPGKRVAKYHRLKEILVEKLDKGELVPGQLFPSDNQLMAEYGLSRSTVRQAMSELVSDGLLERIQGKGTFVSAKAGTPRPALEYAELIFYAGEQTLHTSEFYREVLSGIEETLNGTGTALLIHALNRATDYKATAKPKCISDRLRGGLLILEIFDDIYINELVEAGLPTVVVDHCPAGVDVSSITFDNAGGGQRGTEALIEEGHTRIAFLHGLTSRGGRYVPDPASVEREAGWRAAMDAAGLFDDKLSASGHSSSEGGQEAMKEIVDRGEKPTAVVGSGLGMCAGAREVVRAAGISGLNGDPVKFIGFGMKSRGDESSIRTLACDATSMGRMAAEKLLSLAAGGDQSAESVRVPVPLL